MSEDPASGSYLDAVRAGLDPATWTVTEDGSDAPIWISLWPEGAQLPRQGWKLHVSATVADAPRVLDAVVGVLERARVPAKVAASHWRLAQLNEGLLGLSQVGKFVTVYPGSEEQAVALARELDEATAGARGPAVPSDRRLSPTSVVSYRYGAFVDDALESPAAGWEPVIAAPDGSLERDVRGIRFSPPAWASDPFEAAGLGDDQRPDLGVHRERFVEITTLTRTARGHVSLAIDVRDGKRCVVKTAFRDALVDSAGHDAVSRLNWEAEVLRRLAPDPRVPGVVDLFDGHGGDRVLVLEDVAGMTVERRVALERMAGRFLPIPTVAAWGCEVARLLEHLHEEGLAYTDTKPSNVIVTESGELRFVDFELATPLVGGAVNDVRGTRGYLPPERRAGGPPSIAADVYGLGALLFLMATGAEPGVAPDPADLLCRPLGVLRPGIDARLAAVIERCLAHDPAQRFERAADVVEALRPLLESRADSTGGRDQRAQPPSPDELRSVAMDVGEMLAATGQARADGWVWPSTYSRLPGIALTGLYDGTAGVVLALAELVASGGGSRIKDALAGGARTLMALPPGSAHPGLFAGEAGSMVALGLAGIVLDDAAMVDAARQTSARLAAGAPDAPDLAVGAAGRARAHLLVHRLTGDDSALDAADAAGRWLLTEAEWMDGGTCRWITGPGYGALSGPAWLGYAHGTAGISDVLLDLAEATGAPAFASTAAAGAARVLDHAVPALDGGDGIDWPKTEGGDIGGAWWCHGAGGVLRCFAHRTSSPLVTGDDRAAAREATTAAARTVAQGMRWIGPTYCHGLAGNVDVLLDAHASTGDDEWLGHALDLACLLLAHTSPAPGGGRRVCSDDPDCFTPDLMVGAAGVALVLLRLADPSRPGVLAASPLTPAT